MVAQPARRVGTAAGMPSIEYKVSRYQAAEQVGEAAGQALLVEAGPSALRHLYLSSGALLVHRRAEHLVRYEAHKT